MIPKTVIMRGGKYKCRVFDMHLKLRDHQLKIIPFIYIYIYPTNQKPIIDTHTQKEKGIQT